MLAMTALECVVSQGGPLLAVPSELAGHWRGVLPPVGAAVPEGWAWGDGGVVCDYDRACDDMDDAVTVGDLVRTWSVPVGGGGGRALVLDGELGTTAVPWEDGVVLLRDAPVETEAEAREIVAAVEPTAWRPSSHELDLSEGRLFVFDSAAEGAASAAGIDAEGGVLDLALKPGRYRAHYAAPGHPSGARLTLIRLTREGPPA